MTRTARFQLVCRLLAALFLFVAVARLALSVVPLIDPLLKIPSPDCASCGFTRDPVSLLEPEHARKTAWQTPGTEERIALEVQKPRVRLMLFGAHLVLAVPSFMLFVALAFALRSFANQGFNRTAVRWLRIAALASILWALAHPIAQSMRWTALSAITHGREVNHLVLDLTYLVWPTLLSLAVWVCVWAVEEALSLQQDLEEYV